MPLFRSGNVLSSVLSMWTNKKPIHISNGGVQSDLTLTRTITQLKIGSTRLTTSDFVDGVIPVYVGFLVVGSGAGGGCSSGTTGNGTGGSGGGAVFGILNIETNSSLKLHYGAGGYGGYRNTNVSDSDGKRFRGGFGETSYVCPSNNTSVSSRIFSGGGGSPGNTSEYSGNSTSAGQPSYTSAVILPQTQRGGMGGGKGKAGGGTTVITFKMTAATLNTKAPNASGRLDMTCPARSGGTSGNSATGGGGASILGNGGNGGKTAENGKNGDSGAGGGGGR